MNYMNNDQRPLFDLWNMLIGGPNQSYKVSFKELLPF